jgi:hypothetical protein
MVGIARVFDEAQPVSPGVGLDGAARLLQPGPGPDDAVAQGFARHRREAGRAGATQCLQQEGLGLVEPMVGEQHHLCAAGARHVGQRRVALAPRPGLDAFTAARSTLQAPPRQAYRQAAASPAPSLALQMDDPVVGNGLQTVMHMQCHHLQGAAPGGSGGGMPQRRGIQAATDGHGDARPCHGPPGRRGRRIQRSLVSLKRP